MSFGFTFSFGKFFAAWQKEFSGVVLHGMRSLAAREMDLPKIDLVSEREDVSASPALFST